MNSPQEPHVQRTQLREHRKDLHGKRRDLHERLSEVCEEFVAGELTRDHKQKALVRELRYLLDFYADDDSWGDVA